MFSQISRRKRLVKAMSERSFSLSGPQIWCKYRHISEILQEISIFFLKNREKDAFLWGFWRIFREKSEKSCLQMHKMPILRRSVAGHVELIGLSGYMGLTPYYIYRGQNSADLGVRGKGMTSRMFCMPVTKRMRRSKPRPKPAWGQEP